MKSLVLAEKPSVGKEIARVLGCKETHKSYIEGNQYIVTWAFGHLVELAEPEDYHPKYKTWNLEDLPIMPDQMRLKVMKETKGQFHAIAQLAKRSDIKELIIATDAGREGELVARWTMEMIHWKKPYKRLWISSQTDQAIRDGFAHLKPGKSYDPLYHSAQCRAEADWLIGLNVTRALTSKYNAQLAAGRVQTPTLSMLIQREREIRSFLPVPYWMIRANFGTFSGTWFSGSNSRIMEEAKANQIMKKVNGEAGRVKRVVKQTKSEAHPLAYDLNELQRDANNKYGFSAKKTLTVLQRLYESQKLVTYPRTDSRYLTTDMVSTFKSRLKTIAVGPYAESVQPLLRQELSISKRVVDNSKVSDHHAIIPTEQPPRIDRLDADERKLYDLIVRRFIALFYPPYQYDIIRAEVEVAQEIFQAEGRVVKEWGWKSLYNGDSSMDAEGGHERIQSLPTLQQDQKLAAAKAEVVKKMTEPPKRFSEADLLAQMEKKNLGTPATRADIIEKLLHTETIERQGKLIFPTQKGNQLIDLVAEVLRSPELTAKWEEELERIAQGKGDPKAFISQIRNQTHELVKEIIRSEVIYKPHNVTGSKCPECGEFLRETKGKKGKVLACPNQECKYRRSAENQMINKRCPQCHKKMELRTGKAGKYAHCRPCNVIEMLQNDSPGKGSKKNDRQLVKKYTQNEGLSSSLGDALKAALEQQDTD